MNEQLRNNLQTFAKLFFICYLLGLALLTIWFVIFLAIGNLGHTIHSFFFNISEYDYKLMSYYGMAAVKIFSFVFFLIPFIAIKLTLKRKK